jgi:3-oxoadipate enol-lactonase
MPFLQVADHIEVHYELDDHTDPWRNAPVLVLQHGNGRSAKFWSRWVPYLSRHYRVVRPDMRGLGRSRGALDLEHDITPAHLVADLEKIIDATGGGPVHFCGESMGGILGIILAARRPELVRSLTLVATPVFIEQGMKEKYSLGHGSRTQAMEKMGIRAWVAATTRGTRLPEAEEPELFNWYVEEFSKGSADVQVAMSRVVNEANVATLLPDVKAPVLGLYPTSGQITSADQEALLVEGLPGMQMVHLPTAYHMVQLLFPKTCTARLLEFCSRIDGVQPLQDR